MQSYEVVQALTGENVGMWSSLISGPRGGVYVGRLISKAQNWLTVIVLSSVFLQLVVCSRMETTV